MSWMLPRRGRATEGLADSMAASGAWTSGFDPLDGDSGFRSIGASRREVPAFTRTRARAMSVHAYRTNPMGRAILDTYTSFCVGDSGVKLACTSPEVEAVAKEFWNDPRNDCENRQDILLRSHMLEGETALEMMVGPTTGVARYSYIDPEAIDDIVLHHGNPFWPAAIRFATAAGVADMPIIQVDDITQLRTGDALYWADWRAVASDRRGYPFLAPVLDWLDQYDQIIWNLMDRTAIARHMVFDVTVDGNQDDIDRFVAARGGTHAPRAGTTEVHNPGVEWKVVQPQVGSYEDKQTAQLAMTNIAGGAGLAKTWLAEPEDANRATSLTMAEPVRRRVGGVQTLWMLHQTEMVRFVVDRAVAANRLPATVKVKNDAGGEVEVPASSTVRVVGPEIAAADAKVNADILVQLSTALTAMTLGPNPLLSPEAAAMAAQHAWESFMGVPYNHALDKDGGADDLAEYLDGEKNTEVASGVDRLVAV